MANGAEGPKYVTEETVVALIGSIRTEMLGKIEEVRQSIEAAAKNPPAAPAPAEDAASRLLARIRG